MCSGFLFDLFNDLRKNNGADLGASKGLSLTISKLVSFVTHNGNGSNKTFPYAFKIPSANDLEVFLTDPNGVQGSPLSESEFSIDGLGSEDGGNVVYPLSGSAIASGYKITIRRITSLNQTTKIRDQRRYDPKAIEDALDKLTLVAQENADAIARSVKVPFGEELPDTLDITADITTVADNISNINTVAENLNGSDTIGIVATLESQLGIVTDNIVDIIEVANGIGQISNSLVALSTAAATGHNFVKGEIGYVTSDGVKKANASALATTKGLLVMATATINAGSTGSFLVAGILDGFTGLDSRPEISYYLATTDGAFTTQQPYVPGTWIRAVGSAISDTEFNFSPSNTPPLEVQSNSQYPAVVLESSSSAFSDTGTINCPKPADTAVGDLLVAFISTDFSSSATNTYTPPSGFASLMAYTRTNPGAEGVAMQAFYKFAVGDEADTLAFGEDANRITAVVMLRISGADPVDFLEASSISSAHASEPSLTSIDSSVDDVLNIAAVCWDGAKTLIAAPSGFTQAQHVDLSANPPGVHDLYVGSKKQALAGATGTITVDLSASEDWVGFNLAIRKQGATNGSVGGGTSGPWNLPNDGLGYSTKLTLPLNQQGVLPAEGTEGGNALEIFCTTSPSYQSGKPQLETYTHPIYFLRTSTAYRMATPLRGERTGNASSARCEFRHERNYGPTEEIYFYSKFKYIQGPAGSKCTNVQIHRSDASPVLKMVMQTNTAGTSWTYRALVKKVGDNPDETVDKDGKNTNAKAGIAFDQEVEIYVRWNQASGDLKIWIDTTPDQTPTRWFTGVLPINGNGQKVTSYIKPHGVYPSDVGSGTVDDLFIIDGIDFQIVEDAPTIAPSNTSLPTISGTAVEGQTLTASTGVWAGSAPINYTHQWKRDGVAISGATNPTYVIQNADVGHNITDTVTATNSLNSASATSLPVTPVGLSAPSNTVAPVVSGLAQEGAVLTCTTGVWEGSEPIDYTFQWYRSPSTAIPGATLSGYGLQAADVGHTIFCRVTGTNTVDSDDADSNTTVTVTAAPPFALLSSVAPNVCFELDATNDESYTGSGTDFSNIEPAPADGSAQTDYDFTISGLTFNGTPGDAAAYFSTAGSGFLEIQAASIAAMPEFVRDLGKLTGGQSFWFLIFKQIANSAGEQTIFSTAGPNATDLGVRAYLNSSETARFYQRGDANSRLTSQTQALSVSTDTFWAMCHNPVGGETITWNGLLTGVVTDSDYYETTTDPSELLRIFARDDSPNTPVVSGGILYTVAMGLGMLTDTDMENIVALIEARHARDYTP